MSKTYTRKIGTNRGKQRLWLEGAVLLDNGFTHKSPWEVSSDAQGLHLKATVKGPRLVAGTAERPIIDINAKGTLDAFACGDVVTVEVIRKGHLLIKKMGG